MCGSGAGSYARSALVTGEEHVVEAVVQVGDRPVCPLRLAGSGPHPLRHVILAGQHAAAEMAHVGQLGAYARLAAGKVPRRQPVIRSHTKAIKLAKTEQGQKR